MSSHNLLEVQKTTTRIYAAALFLVALLSFSAYALIHKVIAEHTSRAGVINMSGRQRMLSQRIALFAAELRIAKVEERAALREKLSDAVVTFETTHRGLSRGSGELGEPNAEVKEIYFGPIDHLDQDSLAFTSNARVLLDPATNGRELDTAYQGLRNAALDSLLPKLNRVVTLNQNESESQVLRLHQAELLILVLTLALLSAEAIFIFRPMTQRIGRLFQEALDAREAALKATDEKSAFLATITHEIRTPLTGVFGIIESLQDSKLPAGQLEQINVLGRLTNSLLALVNDILDYSKIEAGQLSIEMVDFSAAALTSDTRILFAPAAQAKGIELTLDLDPKLPIALRGDPTRIRQVITNLIGNALKFTPRGGSVQVRIRRSGEGQDPLTLRAEVHDTGCGIPAFAQAAIFGRYQQAEASTSRKYGGTGLGLAICKQIVEAMGGKIGFESKEGHGSTFWFEVNLMAAEIAGKQDLAAAILPLAALGAWATGLDVLLAEDNEVNQRIFRSQLEKLGFNVTAVENGKLAGEAAEKKQFHLILLDCEMPVADGFEAARFIRSIEKKENRAVVSILALTGHSAEVVRAKCASAGMNGVLTKPFRQAALSAALQPWVKRDVGSPKAA